MTSENRSVLRDESITEFYLKRLEELWDYMETVSVINNSVYKRIIEIVPCDLASRLRLVPDAKLSSRLDHLLNIARDVLEQREIAGATAYYLISIEGSNKTIPFDCDLVIENVANGDIIFIDYTASTNSDIIHKKNTILSQNLSLHLYKQSKHHVHIFKPTNRIVDIAPIFSSSEPGTEGLKIMDHVSTLDPEIRSRFIEKCKEVYNETNECISFMDNSNPPGDYKGLHFTEEWKERSISVLQSQNDFKSISFLRDCKSVDKSYFPYFDGVKELLMRSNEFKPLVFTEGAKALESRDLVANLAELSDDPLAKVLHAACLTDNVVHLDEALNVSIASDFPPTDSASIISNATKVIIAAQRKKGHVFTIKFSERFMDPKLKRIMVGSTTKKDKRLFRTDSTIDDEQVIKQVIKIKEDYESAFNYFSSLSLTDARDTIWKKIMTISALSSNDLENFGRSASSMLDSYLAAVSQTYLGSCMSHVYEVYKSILASLKTSPSDNSYYVGVNGSYKSVTVTKMSSTLDSFTRCAFSVIYSPEREPKKAFTRASGVKTATTFRTHFYSADGNTLAYNLRLPFIATSLSTWEIENNLESGAISNGMIAQIMIDSAFVTMINRDQFAQASEQVRYFYMSSIGYGGSAADIVDKTTFIRARHGFEIMYLLRAYKLAAGLSILSNSGDLGRLAAGHEGELSVCFPHSSYPVRSFSQTISSMYICNIYNKFRAFHEVSEAICYNEIMAERDIYRARIDEDSYAVMGLSPELVLAFKKGSDEFKAYICSDEFTQVEVQFNTHLAVLKSNRYCGSATYMIGASATHLAIGPAVIDAVYNKISKSPIEACTMKGGMEMGESQGKRQGIRAASAVLEELITETKMEPTTVNKSILGATYFIDKIMEEKKEFSILSCVINQFNDGSVTYRYRIVQKDQKGHREISVLNFHFRVGALFVETMTREISTMISDIEIANNPNKDKIIEDTFMSTFEKESKKDGVYCYDNSDQKRWGPNHNMNFFSYALMPIFNSDPGLFRLAIRVFDLTFDKRAKYPESLVNLIVEKNKTFSASEPINTFMHYAVPKINAKIYEERLGMGMCQGIYQQTSSTIHSLKVSAHAAVVNKIHPNVTIKSLTTSDDAEQVIFIPYGLDRVEVVKSIHSTNLRTGNLFNIVRSNPKSAYNFHIGELNSIFVKRGKLATPSLKQRIAKIDVGSGLNHIEDFLSCLSSAANYLASGGSYMGSIILSILNLTLHTEQWLRWEFAKSTHYYKAVEFGGYPVIEPVSTIISGGVSNMYQRVCGILNPEAYSRLVVNSLLCPPEEITLEDFSRRGPDKVYKSFKNKDMSVFKGTGPLGIFQMVKTDRKLSQFERRHGISKWPLPESFATLKRDSSLSSDFLFSLFRNTSISTLETNIGVNGFFIRMAEPWASFSRPCLRMSKFSPFAQAFTLGDNIISNKDLVDKMSRLSIVESGYEMDMAFRRTVFHPEFEIMEAQLGVRLADAKKIFEYLKSQEAETFKVVHCRPSIQSITLRGHTAADSDSYLLTIVKTLAGPRSRGLINEFKHSSTAYESIIANEPLQPMNLLTSIVMADNAISLYEKFIRKNTKMTIPNRVDGIKELVLDILKNKFTEHLGVVLEGSLELNAERAKPYAYSKWYQELMKLSTQFETSVSNAILAKAQPPAPYIGISSSRPILTKSDNFELVDSSAAEKTVLLDVRTKDQLIGALRTWLSAKVRFVLTRETIKAFVLGRLTFAHDYYIGNNTYYRYAKSKYLNVYMGASRGLHVIQTSVKYEGQKKKTTYRHIFLFDDNVTGRKPRIELTELGKQENWCLNLKQYLENVSNVNINYWYGIQSDVITTRTNYRKTERESDFFIFRKMTPGMEFRCTTAPNSLCLNLSTQEFTLPVSYLQPDKIRTLKLGYQLFHDDLVIATKLYSKLRHQSSNFAKPRLQANPDLMEALDFILVYSTTDTPEFIINKKLREYLGQDITAVQLDLIRTFMIKNPKLGIGFSASRFNQYLLNLGQRRRHDHSYLIKTVLGTRAEMDSEDADNQSVEEDIVATGKSDPHEFNDFESDDEYEQPEHVRQFDDSAILDESIENPDITTGNWADEVMETLAETQPEDILLSTGNFVEEQANWAETAQALEFGFESSTDEESEAEEDNHSEAKLGGVQFPSSRAGSPPNNNSLDIAAMFKDLLGDTKFDDVFDPEADDDANSTIRPDNGIDAIDDIFRKAISGTYEKIKDVKDVGLKSERTGHTVNPTLENARSLISFLQEWITKVGDSMEFDQNGVLSANVSSITGMYLLMDQLGVMEITNVLEKFYKMDGMYLPVDLSALAIVGELY